MIAPRTCLFFSLLLLSLVRGLAADVRVGLVSYWPLDVDNSGTTPDVASGNDMTIFNGSNIVPGTNLNAFTFNGTSQYLGINHSTDNSVNGLPVYNSANGYTVSLWVKGPPIGASNSVDRYLFTEGSTLSANPFLALQTRNGATAAASNKLDVVVRTTGGGTPIVNHLKSGLIVFDNTWHHLAWTDDHGAAKLYVDGNLDPTSFNYSYTAGSLTLNTTAIGALVRSTVGGYATNTVIDDEIGRAHV